MSDLCVPRRWEMLLLFLRHSSAFPFFLHPALPSFPPVSPSKPHYHLSCSMSWLIPFPSSCALNAARANTGQEYHRDGFSLWLLGGTALLGRFRHTLRGHEGRTEAQPVNVIPTAHVGLNRGEEPFGANIGNNWEQIKEIKCFLLWHCENLARPTDLCSFL